MTHMHGSCFPLRIRRPKFQVPSYFALGRGLLGVPGGTFAVLELATCLTSAGLTGELRVLEVASPLVSDASHAK